MGRENGFRYFFFYSLSEESSNSVLTEPRGGYGLWLCCNNKLTGAALKAPSLSNRLLGMETK